MKYNTSRESQDWERPASSHSPKWECEWLFVFLCDPEINWPQVQGFTSPSLEDSWDGLQLPECGRSGRRRRNNNNDLRERETEITVSVNQRRIWAVVLAEEGHRCQSHFPLPSLATLWSALVTIFRWRVHTRTHMKSPEKRDRGARALLTPWLKHQSQTLPLSHDAKSSLTAHVDSFFPWGPHCSSRPQLSSPPIAPCVKVAAGFMV